MTLIHPETAWSPVITRNRVPMPSPFGAGEHLPTWATDAVAVVTAGRWAWRKPDAAGEMIRLSGTPGFRREAGQAPFAGR